MNFSANPTALALGWLQATLFGTVASTIAIIAVASIGFLMLSGRIDVRRAAQLVFGCFIIFGASTVANGIMAAVHSDRPGGELTQAAPPPVTQLPTPTATPQASTSPYDPYAGAALPPR